MNKGQHRHNNNRQQQRGRGGQRGGGGGGGGGRPGGNPINRVYESNGPDVKVRGTAQTVAEKYQQLARDAHSAGDRVLAESYYQHAEHYFRILTAAQAFVQQQQAQQQQQWRGREEGFEDEIDTTETAAGDQASDETGDEMGNPMGNQPQPDMDTPPMFTPAPAREGREPREFRGERDNRDRDNRDRPRRFEERRPWRERNGNAEGESAQPAAAQPGEDGWTGPQPSFLRRPVAGLAPVTPVSVAPAEAAPEAEAPAPRARRPRRVEAPVAEAGEATVDSDSE